MKTIKEAKNYLHYLHKKRNYRRDLLKKDQLESLAEIESELKDIIKQSKAKAPKNNGAEDDLKERLHNIRDRMEAIIPPTKSEGWTENVEVILTAIVWALALKAFILAPFKIPTGSMQPTLYGITCQSLAEVEMPNPAIRVVDSLVFGTSYHQVRVKSAGTIRSIRPGSLLGLIEWVNVDVGGENYFLLCSYDTFLKGLAAMLDVETVKQGQISSLRFQKGDYLANFRSKAGDRLLVNRMVYHFTKPEVGQIFVFNTQGIRGIEAENSIRQIDYAQFYIKRCVGIPGDKLSIEPPYLKNHGEIVQPEEYKDDFTRIYSREDGYNGYHLFRGTYAKINEITDNVYLRDDDYFAMGDNSVSSSDSRNWGCLNRRNLVGTGLIVYWPFSSRWGLIQ
jgi:signal peptidase I